MGDSESMNALFLPGGGARAAYQVGVLEFIAEHAPEIRFPILTGVSAGAINAAFLAGHRGTAVTAAAGLAEAWANLTVDRVFPADPAALSLSGLRWIRTLAGSSKGLMRAARGLVDTSSLRNYLGRRIDVDGIEVNVESGRVLALALTTTCYTTGETITFVDGSDGLATWRRHQRQARRARIGIDHVMASCALPLIFPAVRIEDTYYGDGSIGQTAPLAPAVHLGAERILTIATRYPRTPQAMAARTGAEYPPPAQVIGILFNTIFQDSVEADAERLQRINRVLDRVPPGKRSPDELRPIELMVIRPSLDLARLAGAYDTKLPRTVRLLLRTLGAHRNRSPDLISYLSFEPGYISRLFELGYEDAHAQWPQIERFFAGETRAA